LQERYARPEYAFELTQTGGGYQFLTKSAYHDTIALHMAQRSRHRLSTAALETWPLSPTSSPLPRPTSRTCGVSTATTPCSAY
jgi:segregation and condensation protein B